MSPEFGATSTLFPIDDETLTYLRLTGRSAERVALVEAYARAQGLWRRPGQTPDFDDLLTLDLASRRALRRRAAAAPGPRAADGAPRELPVELPGRAAAAVRGAVEAIRPEGGTGRGVVGRVVPGERPAVVHDGDGDRRRARAGGAGPGAPPAAADYPAVTLEVRGERGDDPDRLGGDRRDHLVHQHLEPDGHGRRRAARPERGRAAACACRRRSRRRSRPARRRSPAYLEKAGLMAPLETLGFALAGYGCTTCIGNSGPLDEPIAKAIEEQRARHRGGPVGQPQLRGPDPSARARELPRVAAARRRVRARGPGRHRPDDRAAGHRRRRQAGLPRRHLAVARRDPRRHPRLDRPGAVPADLRERLRGRRPLAGAADPRRRPLRLGPAPRPTSPGRRTSRA